MDTGTNLVSITVKGKKNPNNRLNMFLETSKQVIKWHILITKVKMLMEKYPFLSSICSYSKISLFCTAREISACHLHTVCHAAVICRHWTGGDTRKHSHKYEVMASKLLKKFHPTYEGLLEKCTHYTNKQKRDQ